MFYVRINWPVFNILHDEVALDSNKVRISGDGTQVSASDSKVHINGVIREVPRLAAWVLAETY